eukprot:ctg_728.g361
MHCPLQRTNALAVGAIRRGKMEFRAPNAAARRPKDDRGRPLGRARTRRRRLPDGPDGGCDGPPPWQGSCRQDILRSDRWEGERIDWETGALSYGRVGGAGCCCGSGCGERWARAGAGVIPGGRRGTSSVGRRRSGSTRPPAASICASQTIRPGAHVHRAGAGGARTGLCGRRPATATVAWPDASFLFVIGFDAPRRVVVIPAGAAGALGHGRERPRQRTAVTGHLGGAAADRRGPHQRGAFHGRGDGCLGSVSTVDAVAAGECGGDRVAALVAAAPRCCPLGVAALLRPPGQLHCR